MNNKTLLLLTAAIAATLTLSVVLTFNTPLKLISPPKVPQYPEIPCLAFSSIIGDYFNDPYLYLLEITNTCSTRYSVHYFDGTKNEKSGCVKNDGKEHYSPLYDQIQGNYTVKAC